MHFNFKHYFHFAYLAMCKAGTSTQRLAPRRLLVLLAFYTLFPLLELVTRGCFWLDDVFYPAYREETVHAPVFIVANPRSGTTFLHRLLAQDREHFSWMSTWEMLLAPSIVQRRILKALAALDRRVGSPARKLIEAMQQRWQEKNIMHEIDLFAPEEDEHLLLHTWSTVLVGLYSGVLEATKPWVHFDEALPEREKQRVMDFYMRCLQRHQYAHQNGSKYYLAKNPSFAPKIDALYRYFPDARIIYLVRDPLKVVPSWISLLNYQWHTLGDGITQEAGYPNVLEIIAHWYDYPLERLAHTPQECYYILNFADLVRDPEQAVGALYAHFDMQISADYKEVLREVTVASRSYRSQHRYHLEEMGLTEAQVRQRFAPLFQKFRFEQKGVKS